jgi:hypothetical protein
LKKRILVVLFLSLILGCTSSAQTDGGKSPTTLVTVQPRPDKAEQARNKSFAISLLETIFRRVPRLQVEVANKEAYEIVGDLSVYRERINDVSLDTNAINEQLRYLRYDIDIRVVTEYLATEKVLIDAFLIDIVEGNINAAAVSGGKLSYHWGKWDSMKACILELRSNC